MCWVKQFFEKAACSPVQRKIEFIHFMCMLRWPVDHEDNREHSGITTDLNHQERMARLVEINIQWVAVWRAVVNVPCKNERCHSNQISNLLRHIMIGLTSLCDELLSEIKIECLKKDWCHFMLLMFIVPISMRVFFTFATRRWTRAYLFLSNSVWAAWVGVEATTSNW